jgi:ATP-dependent DNA helicase RecG
VTCLKGVKEQRSELLAHLGVRTVRDLVHLLPVRHEDRSVMTPLASLTPGMTATIRARVERVTRGPPGRRRERFEALLADGTGRIEAVWFNQPWLVRAVVPGLEALFHGTVREHAGRVELSSPELERLPEAIAPGAPAPGRLVPVYPLTAGLHRRTLERMIGEAMELARPCLAESLPAELLGRLELPGAGEALAQAHRPDGPAGLERALERLRFEELFFLELAVAVKRQLFTEARPGAAITDTSGLVDRLRRRLPFALTGAQERAVGQILADLAGPRAMARLVQGDVGSGKTAVALAALMAAAGGGWQGALMAPTEILAGQHYLAIRRLCAELGVGVELLVGSQRTRERRDALEAISSGRSAIAVGTHALIEGGVEFRRLGLAVVDEQHRFGVNQRANLRAKGDNPNLLVMTATPIPRTLALTLYGDLDVSVLDEMPPGRQPIVTRSLPMERVERAYERLREEVALGRQGYVVCPLVEESETLEAEAAERTFEEVRQRWLPGLRVHLLHGRMPGAEKARVMELMRSREADVLVATTVVEVGVDLPDATVMIVLDAERFGLAQLHQLRGRIGRGSQPSVFYPVVRTKSRAARERMAVLEGTADGFVVAEKDLRLRGPGEFFGTRQSGLESLRIASLPRDLRLLEQARQEAFALIARDPGLAAPELAATRAELFRRHGGFVERRH